MLSDGLTFRVAGPFAFRGLVFDICSCLQLRGADWCSVAANELVSQGKEGEIKNPTVREPESRPPGRVKAPENANPAPRGGREGVVLFSGNTISTEKTAKECATRHRGLGMRPGLDSGKRWLVALAAAIGIVFVSLLAFERLKTPEDNTVALDENKSVPVLQNKTEVEVATPLQAEMYKIPVLLPGETCAKAIEVFGNPTEENQYGLSWKKSNISIAADKGPKCVLNGILVWVGAGQKALTQDGVILGKSTLADAERSLRPYIDKDSESVDAPEGNWRAMISIRPAPHARYKVTYRADLSQKTADRMSRDPVFDDFRDVPVTEYDLDIAGLAGQ